MIRSLSISHPWEAVRRDLSPGGVVRGEQEIFRASPVELIMELVCMLTDSNWIGVNTSVAAGWGFQIQRMRVGGGVVDAQANYVSLFPTTKPPEKQYSSSLLLSDPRFYH